MLPSCKMASLSQRKMGTCTQRISSLDANGTHSTVRREMVRLANEVPPGHFSVREFDSE